jgi:hypothetical protein
MTISLVYDILYGQLFVQNSAPQKKNYINWRTFGDKDYVEKKFYDVYQLVVLKE